MTALVSYVDLDEQSGPSDLSAEETSSTTVTVATTCKKEIEVIWC